MNLKQIKQEAKDAIKGGSRWGYLFLVIAIVGMVAGITATLLAPVLAVGLYYIALDMLEGKDIDGNHFKKPFGDLNHVLKLIALALLVGAIVALGTLFLIVPGILFSYRYSQALRIMIDDPDIKVLDALKKSQEMMRGHKVELFLFQLSFIGHYLLVFVTFGIYTIYFAPLLLVAETNYYRHLKNEKNPDVIDV